MSGVSSLAQPGLWSSPSWQPSADLCWCAVGELNRIHPHRTRRAIPSRAASSQSSSSEQRLFISGSKRENGPRSVQPRPFALIAVCHSGAQQRGMQRGQAALGAVCHILPLLCQPTPLVKLSIPKLLEFCARNAKKYLFWGFFSLNPAPKPARSSCCSFSPLPLSKQPQEHAPRPPLEMAILNLLFKNWFVLPGRFIFRLHWARSAVWLLWNTEPAGCHSPATPALLSLKIRIRKVGLVDLAISSSAPQNPQKSARISREVVLYLEGIALGAEWLGDALVLRPAGCSSWLAVLLLPAGCGGRGQAWGRRSHDGECRFGLLGFFSFFSLRVSQGSTVTAPAHASLERSWLYINRCYHPKFTHADILFFASFGSSIRTEMYTVVFFFFCLHKVLIKQILLFCIFTSVTISVGAA